MFLVVVAHAVIDPWAVVVHPGDTRLAYAAVVALRRLDGHTFSTPLVQDLLELSLALGCHLVGVLDQDLALVARVSLCAVVYFLV